MSQAPQMQTTNELNYWVGTSPDVLGNDIGGLSAPVKTTYFVCENLTDDGLNFDAAPFRAGRLDGVLRLMDAEEGEKIFESVSATLSRRAFAGKMVENDNDAVVALWEVGDKRLLFVGESETSLLQDAWYDCCRFAGIPPFDAGVAFSATGFDVSKIPSDEIGEELTNVISQLKAPVVRAKVGM